MREKYEIGEGESQEKKEGVVKLRRKNWMKMNKMKENKKIEKIKTRVEEREKL